MQQFRYAVMFYKVINDTEMILKCYKQLVERKLEDAYKIRMEMGEYLISVVQFEDAKKMLKIAADSTSDSNLKLKAYTMMIGIIDGR